MTELFLRSNPDLPVEAEVISPERFRGKTLKEIAGLPIFSGNQCLELGELFSIRKGKKVDILLEGDLSKVKRIGSGMGSGRIIIDGDAGMHLGAGMCGGRIDVHGNSGDWTGAEMKGGCIHIRGNAGHCLGGAYRGSLYGMNKGEILVDGNTGSETGAFMRRGLIVVKGNTEGNTGAFVVAGSIIVQGSLGKRPGAGMKRGTIITGSHADLLPTFIYDCTYQPTYLRLLYSKLKNENFYLDEQLFLGKFKRYSGDMNILGKGEILIYDQC